MLFFVVIVVVISSIVQTHCAQPRSVNLLNLETAQSESLPLVHYSKRLQTPLAFSYTQDSKISETSIKQKRYNTHHPEPIEIVKKLNTKRILRPKKYLHNDNVKDISKDIVPKDDFIIYIPEENQPPNLADEDLLQAPIIVPELSEEELRQVEEDHIAESDQGGIPSVSVATSDVPTAKLVEVDQKVQETHHKKHKPKPKPKDTKYEKGDEKSAKSGHHKTSKDKGDKGYKGEHKKYKVEKEHHAKVGKAGHHEDAGGDKKKYHKEHDFYAEHQEEDEGNNGSKFDEEGENDKGHATKGTHNVNKKEEYVKKIEFFDEYHEDSDSDEDGGHEDDEGFKKGHHEHKDHHKSDFEHDGYDNHKDHEDAHDYKTSKGKHDVHAHKDYHDYDDIHDKKSNHGSKKIWKVVVTDSSEKDSGSKEHKSQ